MAVNSVIAAGVTGIIVAAAVPAATAGEHRPSPFAPHSSSPAAEPSPAASPTRAAPKPSLELRGLPDEFVPGADWREFAIVLHHADTAKEFNRLFFQVHDTQQVGLKADQIKVQYLLDGRWQSARSFNDPTDNWQDFPIPEDEGPMPADTTEIPVRLRFGADSPLTDRIDIGAASYYGPTEIVEIQPLKAIRLVRDTPGEPSPTAGPTGAPGEPSPTAGPTGAPGEPSPTAGPTGAPGEPSPTAGPTGDPGESSPGVPGQSATAAPPASGGRAGPSASSGPATPASGGELARTGGDAVGTPLIASLIALGSGMVLALAVRAARVRRRRH
ncbi:hypothetical protein [Kitasatospora sp. NPDC085464]|uniref:hypothetical protein n=1 Tax=Kitasatospora sp. NPDC085464 TaxID=3364063 RepID=UPI0037CBA890